MATRFITPPACRRVHTTSRYMYTHTHAAVLGRFYYQLSESTSLLLSSVFSADVLVDLLHFWEFSDSSDEDLFCLLHFARLFLNQTYMIEKHN